MKAVVFALLFVRFRVNQLLPRDFAQGLPTVFDHWICRNLFRYHDLDLTSNKLPEFREGQCLGLNFALDSYCIHSESPYPRNQRIKLHPGSKLTTLSAAMISSYPD